MKLLLVTFALVAVATARPDVSHIPTGSYLPTGGGFDFGGSSSGISGISGIGGIGGVGGAGGGQFQDQKHVFFFGAPDDEAAARLRINIAPASSRNTKVIFVKAPSYGRVIPEVIAPPSTAEDKTLVYVLVKRPQQGGSISIPASATVKQAKPEVYFIKYRSQQDAERQISGTLSGASAGSNVPDLGNEASFVRTLDSGIHGGGGGGGFGGDSGFDGFGSGSVSTGITSIGGGGGLVSGGGRYGPAGVSGPYKR